MKYDVIVVGGRCAGAATGMLLAKSGKRVLILDRARFPSDVLSAHYIHHTGCALLDKWGLLPAVAKSNCPAITSCDLFIGTDLNCRIDYSSKTVVLNSVSWPLPPDKIPHHSAYSPRRRILDSILISSAINSGVEFREGVKVHGLSSSSNGRVDGVFATTSEGTEFAEQAELVVGADGCNSIVATNAGSSYSRRASATTCSMHGYWSGYDVSGMEVYVSEGQLASVIPTNDQVCCIGLSLPFDRFVASPARREKLFRSTLAHYPALNKKLAASNLVEPIVGTRSLVPYFRKAHGPGWALAGDAKHVVNPIAGRGISNAFRDAEALALAISDILSGHQTEDSALEAYAYRRETESSETFELSNRIARLERPTFEHLELFRKLGNSQPLSV